MTDKVPAVSAAEALLLEAVRHAEWQDKHIHPFNGETYQTWRLTVHLPVPLSQADKSPETALHLALRNGNGDAGDTPEHTTGPCGEPAAWYVLRVAPGMRDDGMRLGPFWRREEAESWADEQHVVVPLYGAAEVLRLQALLRTVADAFDDWQKPTPGAGREWCERFSTYLRGAVVATASFTSEEWAEVEKWMTPTAERRPSSLASEAEPGIPATPSRPHVRTESSMKIQHLEHKHGGRILSLDAIAHETYQRRASWHFVGRVQWADGSKSESAEIAPFSLCYDHANADAAAELSAALTRLNDYLARHGKWQGGKWKPAATKGSEALS